MSPNKDETGCRLSRMLFLLVVRYGSLFITDGKKHFNFVDDGGNKYWLIFLLGKKFRAKISIYKNN